MKKYYIFAVIISLYTIGMILVGFNYGGSPLTQKKLKVDQARIGEINNIKYKIESYVIDHKKLPTSLNDLSLQDKQLEVFKDSKLEYKVISQNNYTLCTTFEVDRSKGLGRDPYSYTQEPLYTHGNGYQCIPFSVVIRDVPALYNPQTNVVPVPLITPTTNVATNIDPYTYKGDSDPKNDLVQSGTLEAKSFASDNTTVIAFSLLYKIGTTDANGSMTFLLDENSKITSGNTTIKMSDIRVGDNIQVTYGKTTNGAHYARIVNKTP